MLNRLTCGVVLALATVVATPAFAQLNGENLPPVMSRSDA